MSDPNPESDLVLAVDCSTSGSKAVVFDPTGRSIASGRSRFPMSRPQVGWHEQNAVDWWDATSRSIVEAAAAVDPRRIAAVVVTHQRETFVCVDESGRPLRSAIVWADNRSTPQIARYGSEETHRISGRIPDITPSIFKLAWLKEHEPEVLRDAAHIGDVSSYLNFHLTGSWTSSASSADSLGLMDIVLQEWSPLLCDIAGVSVSQLPSIARPGSTIGHLSEATASELGLLPGTAVIAGAGDGQCAALGAGVTGENGMYLNLGTAIVAGYHSPDYLWSRRHRTVLEADGDGYILETVQQAGAYLITWFIENFAHAPGDAPAETVLEGDAAGVPAGSDGLLTLPYWNGAQTPYWDSTAQGAVVGWTGSHTRAHFYRSLLEGIAFDIRLSTDGVEADVGRPITRYLATGGGSRSALWNQIVADVTGREVHVCAETETTALGAAMLAFRSLGVHPDLHTAADAMTAAGDVYRPDQRAVSAYRAQFDRWNALYPAIRDALVIDASGASAESPDELTRTEREA